MAPYGPPTVWPLVGRGTELERIGEIRRSRGTCGVVVRGAAGVGKSRLAREVLREAGEDGEPTEWIQATRSAATVPLAAFAGLFDGEPGSGDPAAMMRRYADALSARSARRRVALFVDDAQLLDPTSAALVRHLASSGAAFVVATARSGEICPDAIESLWKDSGAARIELDVLGDAETARLVESALGGPASQAALEWLTRTSGGNALFLSELIRGAVESGALATEQGLWHLVAPDSAVGPSLRDLIAERTRDLSAEQREALEILALSEPLPLDELIDLSSPDVVVQLEELAMLNVRDLRAQTHAVSGHPLFSEVVRSSMPVTRGRVLRSRIAQAFRRRDELDPSEALRVVTWLLEARETPPPGLLLAAARAALGAGDPATGARFATLAIEDGAGSEATMQLARSHIAQRRFDEAERLLAPLEGSLGGPDLSLTYLELRASPLFWERRDQRAVMDMLGRARGWHDDPGWPQRVGSLEARFAATSGEQRPGDRIDVEALEADDPGDAELERRIAPVRALQLLLDGHALEARALAREARPSVALTDQAERVAFATYVLVALETGGDHDRLLTELTSAVAAAVRSEDHLAAGLAATGLAGLALRAGRLADTRRWLGEAELNLGLEDMFGASVNARALAAYMRGSSGDVERAGSALDRCEEALGGEPPLPTQFTYVISARAAVLLARGDAKEACELLLSAAAEVSDRPVHAVALAYEALRMGARPARVLGPIREAAARTDAPLALACAGDVEARLGGDPMTILTAAEALAEAGAATFAVEALLAAGATFRDQGRRDSARRAVARARALHPQGQGGVEPTLDGLDGPLVGLTRREEQLVDLAARGMSNAEIAERLVLSIRTVESHLYRAMRKLGVGDRRELAAYLPQGATSTTARAGGP